jgi:LytS/YehU family sensor histidine kinase
MLRYQLYGAKDEKVSIEKELQYLQDYIDLQKLRNENCSVQVEVEPTITGIRIEPFLLLPFVENSFKHLSHYNGSRKNEVKISLSKEAGEMEFSVHNTTESNGQKDGEGGIGLVNVKRRLELLYPQKHRLLIEEREGWFCVYLKLKI